MEAREEGEREAASLRREEAPRGVCVSIASLLTLLSGGAQLETEEIREEGERDHEIEVEEVGEEEQRVGGIRISEIEVPEEGSSLLGGRPQDESVPLARCLRVLGVLTLTVAAASFAAYYVLPAGPWRSFAGAIAVFLFFVVMLCLTWRRHPDPPIGQDFGAYAEA